MITVDQCNPYIKIDNADVYITEPSRGVILKDGNGNCHRVFVDLSGSLKAVAIDCP